MSAVRTLLCGVLVATALSVQATEVPRGIFAEGLRCVADPTQTYTLYLPSHYDPDRKWPAMLIMDPRGRSLQAAERFREAAEQYGWILLSSDNTRSGESAEPNVRALNALFPELGSEYSVEAGRIYLAGFSGTAMTAWEVARRRPGLAGVIASGSRFEGQMFRSKMKVPTFGAVGDTDFNYLEMRRVHETLRHWQTPERLEIFVGRHRWMPEDLARQSVEWMELQAMKIGRRAIDRDLVARLHAEDRARALHLEEEGRELDALRRWENLAATYDGLLHDGGESELRIRQLRESRTVQRALKEEKKADQMEVAFAGKMSAAIDLLRRPGHPMTTSKLRTDLGLETLRRRSESPGYEGVVARRILNTLLTQTSFYLSREFLGSEHYHSAVAVLGVATELAEERSDIWYNLACALARTGQKKNAVEALERSVDTGFRDLPLMERDEDLRSLHEFEGFRQLAARLEAEGKEARE